MAVGRSLFKGPLLSLPSAFISFHIAQSLHNIVKVSQVEWELHTKFIREAVLLSHKDPLASLHSKLLLREKPGCS